MSVHRKSGEEGPIRRQAELLAAACHAGVVELVGLEGSSDRPVLVTALVDGPTLAAPMALTVEEVAGLVGELAATLADLHQLGIVHGAVSPEHVLVRPDGRPVLCGFGSAGKVGETGPVGHQELQPSTDVAALGRLLRRLAIGPNARSLRRIAEAATADDPSARPSAREVASELAQAMPAARLPTRQPGTVRDGDAAHDLRSLLADARPDRARRRVRPRRPAPSAARSAGLLGTDMGDEFDGRGGSGDPGAGVDDAVGTGDSSTSSAPARAADAGGRPVEPRPHRRPPLAAAGGRRLPRRAAALAGGLGAVVAVGLLLRAPWASVGRTDGQPRSAPTLATTAVPSSRPAITATTVAPTTSAPPAVRADCPTPASVLVADVDGDGCLDALHYADGVLEAKGVRWSVGQSGDQLATGDWMCRGTRTVVLLRPSTGEVFRFEAWAVGLHDSVAGAAVARVPGGQAVRAADVDRDGCHELVVERGDLPPQVVRLPRPQP